MELGTSLDMIASNLILPRGQEQARVNIFLNSEREVECQESSLDLDNQPDVVDQALMDILKITKEDREDLTNKMVVPFSMGKDKMGERVTLQEVHCKTPVKTKIRCRRGNENK
jgi:hypothetical protein